MTTTKPNGKGQFPVEDAPATSEDAEAALDRARAEAHAKWAADRAAALEWYEYAKDLAELARLMVKVGQRGVQLAGDDQRKIRQAASILIGLAENYTNLTNLSVGAGGAVAGIEDNEPPAPAQSSTSTPPSA